MKVKTLGARVETQPDRLPVMQPGSWRTDQMTTAQRGYGYQWQKARLGWLHKHPLCVYCERKGRLTAATVVDHIEPHRGDMTLFWSRSNWRSLCATCHNSYKQRVERTGHEIGCDADGLPLDAGHHWRTA